MTQLLTSCSGFDKRSVGVVFGYATLRSVLNLQLLFSQTVFVLRLHIVEIITQRKVSDFSKCHSLCTVYSLMYASEVACQ